MRKHLAKRVQDDLDDGALKAIAKGLEHSLASLRSYHTDLSAGVDFLGRGSATLRSEVKEIDGELGSMIERTEMLHSVEDELCAIQQDASGLAGTLPASRRPERKRSATLRYTMESEREVHRNAVQGATQTGTNDPGQPADSQVATGEMELF